MNEDLSLNTVPTEKLASLKQLTLIVYILYALSFFTGITSIVAIIINYVKREETEGTLYASHFTWQIRTFWWSLLWAVLGVVLMLIGVGVVILAVDTIWVIYRVVKGVLNWNDNKPMRV
ncbi:Uncharacterized membrane protein [Roseateles sp. YR242]|uniref:DUF4870 family protein n=1 Tax=Roseateles sp. YR242 TaxID=1855305 RepID=UPI0008C82F53|nr:hypothetical protein [Roseateles sp. YR242]SEK96992.1 Uncharacterized membrane protein [Roseateles sp. YR242]